MTATRSNSRTTAVMIVDDQRPAQMGIAMMVNSDPDMEVITCAANGQEAIDWLVHHRESQTRLPDIVLMDIRMPVLNGIEATAEITRRFPGIKVLIMTTYDEDDYAFGALDAGATGYLLKDTRGEDLRRAIRSVLAGDAVLTPRITAEMIRRRPHAPTQGRQQRARETLEMLSPRELEVAKLVARGLNNAEIGELLFLQPDSVKKSVSRILSRLGLRDRVQIVVLWYEACTNFYQG